MKFDYIHGRALLSCFENPPFVLPHTTKTLTPGGYLKLQDVVLPMKYVGEPPKDCALVKWNKLIVEGAQRSERPWMNVCHYAQWMREIGFEDVEEKTFYWLTRSWPKDKHLKQLSLYVQEDVLSGLEGISMKILMGQLGWLAEGVQVFLSVVRKDLKDRSIRAYTSM